MALPSALWKISVTTTTEAEDAVVELLSRVFDSAASAYTGAESRKTTVTVYCERPRPALEAKRESLRTGLRQIKSCGLDIGPGRVRMQTIPREDWAESWKRHFRPIAIGKELLIKPSWHQRRPLANQALIVLDPGLSFGTGHHPTTEFCLRELVARREMPERGHSPSGERPRSFLDMGTGSGILAIAAAKLGYSPVYAFDFDPEAVRVARANALANQAGSKIQIARVDLAKLPRRSLRRFDVISANLISTTLIAECRRIVARMKPRGFLALAGVLKSEFHQVQTAYESLGLRLVAGQTENEWRSGTFCRVERPG